MNGASFRTAVAAILAGALYFAGQAGELAFSSTDDGDAAFGAAGIVALGVAFWGLREIVSGTRRGRVGIRLALAGFAMLALFAIQLIVEQIRTGDIPDNFILFAFGFLLVTVGQLLFARDLKPTIGRAWALPLVALTGLVVALTLTADPIHDIGLFVFEAAWIVLGVALLRAERRQPHGMFRADQAAT
ncbi:MAG: hypothetical protein ACRDM9_05710 [Gaiellaceae bacterium]